MLRLFVLSAALLASALGLSGCPESKSVKSTGPKKIIFVKGNPYNLIAGAQRDTKSLITVDGAAEFNEYKLVTMTQLVEREKVQDDGKRDIEAENETKGVNRQQVPADVYSINLAPDGAGQWRMSLMAGSLHLILRPESDGTLQIVGATSAKESLALETIHWSRSRDGRYVSVLLGYQDADDGRGLVALYFERPGSKELPATDAKYVYSAGPGIPLGWPQDRPVELAFCGSSASEPLARDAVGKWAKILEGRLEVRYKVLETYRPFSDLNQHCTFVVDAYLSDHREDVFAYGSTLTMKSATNVEIFDADVFIWKAELDKVLPFYLKHNRTREYVVNSLAHDLPIIFLHELGHALGLGHKFDGTPSVMSYEWKHPDPQAYDVETLHHLYPKVR